MWGPSVNYQCFPQVSTEQLVLHLLNKTNQYYWEKATVKAYLSAKDIPVSFFASLPPSFFFPPLLHRQTSTTSTHSPTLIQTHTHTHTHTCSTWSHQRSISLISTDTIVIGFSSTLLMNMDTHTHMSELVYMCTRRHAHLETPTHICTPSISICWHHLQYM